MKTQNTSLTQNQHKTNMSEDEDDQKIFLVRDANGNTYGMNTDPKTNRFFECVGAQHARCTSAIGQAGYMYTWLEDLHQYPRVSPHCIRCHKKFTP